MKKNLLQLTGFFLACFTTLTNINAQTPFNKTPEFLKGNSVWAFPYFAGLDFNSGTAEASVSVMPDKGLEEGAASVCNRNTGELLFYTNGETIWDASHNPMPNGDTLFGNGGGYNSDNFSANHLALTARQGALIVPFVEDTNKYYVFSLNGIDHRQLKLGLLRLTIDSTDSMVGVGSDSMLATPPKVYINDSGDTIQGSLFYSIVDMRLNNGLGDIVPGQKNILLDSSHLSEAMIAVPGAGGCGSIWLLLHTCGPQTYEGSKFGERPPQYKAYEITASGINTTPVLSPGIIHCARGWMCLSPDNSTIAMNGGGFYFTGTIGNGVEIGKFNNQTGEIEQVVVIENFNSPLTGFSRPKLMASVSCFFSPDGRKLYYDQLNYFGGLNPTFFPDTSRLLQCDVSSFDSSSISTSRTTIAAYPSYNGLPALNTNGSIAGRLYNDTIYLVSKSASAPPHYISRINNPNNPGTSCNFEPDAIQTLAGTYPSSGLTLGSETVFTKTSSDTLWHTQDTLICNDLTEGIRLLPAHDSGFSFIWNDNSTDSALTINQSGTYWVNYYTEGCISHSDTFHVTQGNIIPPVITIDSFVLGTAIAYSSYQWLLNDVVINSATQRYYTVQENGFYRVVVSNESCIDTSEAYEVSNADENSIDQHLAQQIRIWPNPAKDEVFVQAPMSINLSLSTISGKVIKQQPSSSSLSLRKLAPGIYLLRISDKDGNLIKVEKLIKTNE